MAAGGGLACKPSEAATRPGSPDQGSGATFPAAGIDIFEATSDVSVYVVSLGETFTVHLEGQIIVQRRDPVRNSNGPREIKMDVTSLELSGPVLGEEQKITIRGGEKYGLPVRGVIRSIHKDRDFPALAAFPMQFEILVPPIFGFAKSRVLRHDPAIRFMEVARIGAIPPVGDVFVNLNNDPLACYDVEDRQREEPVILVQPGVVHDVLAFRGKTQEQE
jgi:hypothetical protein